MKNNIIDEMLKHPESKIAELDKDYNLIMTGNRALKAESYVFVSLLGSIAKFNDNLWLPNEQSFPVPMQLGILNPDKILLALRDIDPKTTHPDDFYPFVLFAMFEGFVDAYIVTSDTNGKKQQHHYMWPEEKGDELLALCFAALADQAPDIAEPFLNFMLAIGGATCEAVADD